MLIAWRLGELDIEGVAEDCERLPETLAGPHVLAFRTLMLGALATRIQGA